MISRKNVDAAFLSIEMERTLIGYMLVNEGNKIFYRDLLLDKKTIRKIRRNCSFLLPFKINKLSIDYIGSEEVLLQAKTDLVRKELQKIIKTGDNSLILDFKKNFEQRLKTDKGIVSAQIENIVLNTKKYVSEISPFSSMNYILASSYSKYVYKEKRAFKVIISKLINNELELDDSLDEYFENIKALKTFHHKAEIFNFKNIITLKANKVFLSDIFKDKFKFILFLTVPLLDFNFINRRNSYGLTYNLFKAYDLCFEEN